MKSKKIIWKEKEGSKLNLFQASLLFLRDYIYLLYFYRVVYFKNHEDNLVENSEENKIKTKNDNFIFNGDTR